MSPLLINDCLQLACIVQFHLMDHVSLVTELRSVCELVSKLLDFSGYVEMGLVKVNDNCDF